jgi:uncharacterized RDD family membrane protein YckC
MSDASTPPGWYPDPSNPAQQRYWDGTAWSDATAPGAPAAAAPAYGAPGAPAYGTTQVGYGYAQAVGAPMASFGARLVGWLVDGILIGIVSSVISAVLGVDAGDPAGNVVSLLIGVPYFLYFEGTTGQTLGKKLAKVQVVGADDLQPGIGTGQAGLRYVGKILSGIPCGLGYFWMLWDDQKQCWHDKIASTKVIKVAG